MAPLLMVPARDLAVEPDELFDGLRSRLEAGGRVVTMWGQPSDDPAELTLTAVVAKGPALEVLRAPVGRDPGFRSLTRDFPALHPFEREIFEQHGVRPLGHPWLKPIRFPGARKGAIEAYPFYPIDGAEVHEVAVGPIHAGVIEPGHFRFMCLGETVHHLEIQLGWQHRGAERLLLARDPRRLTPLVETIAGDTSVAHAWAHAAALEALAGIGPDPAREASRALGVELERIGMHLAGLSGLATDVAFLQGSTSYGRLRTTAINTTQRVCGNRFGRRWVRPASTPAGWDPEKLAAIRAGIDLISRDTKIIDDCFLASATVQHRLKDVGVLTRQQALDVGIVGQAARASGVDLDARVAFADGPYARHPIRSIVEPTGDCWARARVRVDELHESIRFVRELLDEHPAVPAAAGKVGALRPDTLAISIREGWRGEVVHCLETDGAGKLRGYRVQDPSLRNWLGLALAVRNNDISDFPICNKSFDLSYCGHDL